MKRSRPRFEEFRSRLHDARDRLLFTTRAERDALVDVEPHQAGSAWEETAREAAVSTLAALETHECQALDEIAAAQVRLEDGTYGVCERCVAPIALARLRALPAARYCAACQFSVERFPAAPAAR